MSNDSAYKFPFGQMLVKQTSNENDKKHLFILGAYPSALHVQWIPPEPFKSIQAIAVDNEPAIFWDGRKQDALVMSWKEKVNWRDEWGIAKSAGKYNGSSGSWVNDKVISPLGLQREVVWFSDCLDIYHCSKGLEKRLADTYLPFAEKYGVERSFLPEHPDENTIVRVAYSQHLDRLISHLLMTRPAIIVTLGNAALRVLAGIVQSDNKLPDHHSADNEQYGDPLRIIAPGDNPALLLPLAHPGAPIKYQVAHNVWVNNKARNMQL